MTDYPVIVPFHWHAGVLNILTHSKIKSWTPVREFETFKSSQTKDASKDRCFVFLDPKKIKAILMISLGSGILFPDKLENIIDLS